MTSCARKHNLTIVATFTEDASAARPGRPVFAETVERISQGDIEGILTWNVDRLARNPVDAGTVAWLLQSKVITHIRTFSEDPTALDNVLLLAMQFGMATQYSHDLSQNVK